MARNRPSIDLPSEADLKTIISGDPVESAKLTNTWGEAVGSALSQTLATSQIRNIFGQVRQIEMYWDIALDVDAKSLRDLLLLKPKLRYQAERKKEVQALATLLSDAIDLVDNRQKFQRFVDFFEAILAYHKAAGGK